jgi:nucleoside-diphosphate-sugar epimerase
VSLDAGRARRWLGWEPLTAIEDGLAATAAWFGLEPERAAG